MTPHAIDHVFRDLRYALRGMAARPGFAVVTILAMGLGIAASTAVFSVVSAVLLKPLPYPDPDRIVLLVHTFQGRTFPTVSLPRLVAWRANTDAVQEIALFTTDGSANLAYGEGHAPVVARRATASFFTLFGASAMRGRLFTANDDVPGGPRVVVLSHGFWQRHFGGADIVGRTVRIDRDAAVVVGVLSPAFDPRSATPFIVATPDIWLPLQPDFSTRTDANNLIAAARLKPGASLATAQAQCAGGVAAFRQILPQNMPPGMSPHRAAARLGRDRGCPAVPDAARGVGGVRPADRHREHDLPDARARRRSTA